MTVPGQGAHRPPSSRSTVELLEQQLAAMERFHADRHVREHAQAVAAQARESRADAARSLAVLRCQTEALLARSAQSLRACGQGPLLEPAPRRAVLGHRDVWFIERVASGLARRGVETTACSDNGADLVGIAVAEQPDLVLVEQQLRMMPGCRVVEEVLRYCSRAVVVAQVPSGEDVAAMVDAGAVAVFTRQVTPADVAAELGRLLLAPAVGTPSTGPTRRTL